MKAVRGGVKRGDVCYGMLRAAACVDESDHHALMYVWHGRTVRGGAQNTYRAPGAYEQIPPRRYFD